MTTEPEPTRRPSLQDLARTQGVRPIRSIQELAEPDGFDSDEEVDEFIAFVRALRHAEPV